MTPCRTGAILWGWLDKAQMSKRPKKAPQTRPQPDPLCLSTHGDDIVVWLSGSTERPRRIGAVNRRLAEDARRHGQDLVGDLVDEALLAADRQRPPTT